MTVAFNINKSDSIPSKDKEEKRKYIPLDDYPGNDWRPFGPRQESFCLACKKHYAKMHKLGLTETPFPPSCIGNICKAMPTQEEVGLSDAEYELAKTSMDPVAWARYYFNWEPRWYQTEMLLCSSQLKVARAGRRVGKCQPAGSLVYLRNGSRVPIEDLVGKTVTTQGVDPNTGLTIKRQFISVGKDQIKQVVEITLQGGAKIRASINHPMLTRMGWLDAGNLSHGDEIAAAGLIRSEASGNMDKLEIALLAYIIGDGGVTSRKVSISNIEPKIRGEIENIAAHFECSVRYEGHNDITAVVRSDEWHNNRAMKFLDHHGLMGKNAFQKRVPDVVFTLKNPDVALFISRLFACDGWASSRQIGYCSVNEMLCRDIKHLLIRFGVSSSIVWRKTTKVHGAYQLIITGREDVSRFAKNIGIFSKDRAVSNVVEAIGGWENPPEAEPIRWTKIKNIDLLGEMQTYSVSTINEDRYDRQTYLSDDIWSHNTAAIALAGLHYAGNSRFKSVLVVAPFQAQVKKIFDEMKKFISESPDIRKAIAREVNSPPMLIEFHNGSKITGFSSGKNSGSNSDQIRGQDANMILLDEVDFQNDYELETIMAVMATDAECRVWASSTPKGWRRKFYQMCTEKDLGYKEFHYISAESPQWTSKAEAMFRSMTSENGFKHEYLAEFGEEATGVYRSDLIDQCLEKYQLSKCRPGKGPTETEAEQKTRTRVMGVDWNSHAGCHIVIVEWNGIHYKLVHKTIVPKSEFTQFSAIERIVQLDARWNCSHIYVDEGYGTVQIEHLKLTGIRNPATRLNEKVKGIQMARSVIINEPGTGMETKKSTKQFMVELSVHQLEEGRVMLPDEEDSQVIIEPDSPDQPNVGLVQQMRGYTVVRMSSAGQPVYSQDNDHTLTAWQLAILGFMMEYSGFTQTEYATRVEFHDGQLGESNLPSKRTGSKKPLSRTKPLPRSDLLRSGGFRRGPYETIRRNIEERKTNIRKANRGESFDRSKAKPRRGSF